MLLQMTDDPWDLVESFSQLVAYEKRDFHTPSSVRERLWDINHAVTYLYNLGSEHVPKDEDANSERIVGNAHRELGHFVTLPFHYDHQSRRLCPVKTC